MENSNDLNAENAKPAPSETPPPSTSGRQLSSRNPWIIFTLDYRKKHKNLSATNLIKSAATVWRSMSQADKTPFIEEAKRQPKLPKRRRRRRSRKTRGKKPQLRSRSPSNASSTNSSSDKPIREQHLYCETYQISSSEED